MSKNKKIISIGKNALEKKFLVDIQQEYDKKIYPFKNKIIAQLIGGLGKSKKINFYYDTFYLNSSLVFFSKNMCNSLFAQFKIWFEGLTRGYYLSMRLRGIGWRQDILLNSHIMVYRVGKAHFTFVFLPYSVLPKRRRYHLVLFSLDKQILTATAYKLRKFRIPDSYKHKGVLFFNEFLKKKPGKIRQR